MKWCQFLLLFFFIGCASVTPPPTIGEVAVNKSNIDIEADNKGVDGKDSVDKVLLNWNLQLLDNLWNQQGKQKIHDMFVHQIGQLQCAGDSNSKENKCHADDADITLKNTDTQQAALQNAFVAWTHVWNQQFSKAIEVQAADANQTKLQMICLAVEKMGVEHLIKKLEPPSTAGVNETVWVLQERTNNLPKCLFPQYLSIYSDTISILSKKDSNHIQTVYALMAKVVALWNLSEYEYAYPSIIKWIDAAKKINAPKQIQLARIYQAAYKLEVEGDYKATYALPNMEDATEDWELMFPYVLQMILADQYAQKMDSTLQRAHKALSRFNKHPDAAMYLDRSGYVSLYVAAVSLLLNKQKRNKAAEYTFIAAELARNLTPPDIDLRMTALTMAAILAAPSAQSETPEARKKSLAFFNEARKLSKSEFVSLRKKYELAKAFAIQQMKSGNYDEIADFLLQMFEYMQPQIGKDKALSQEEIKMVVELKSYLAAVLLMNNDFTEVKKIEDEVINVYQQSGPMALKTEKERALMKIEVKRLFITDIAAMLISNRQSKNVKIIADALFKDFRKVNKKYHLKDVGRILSTYHWFIGECLYHDQLDLAKRFSLQGWKEFMRNTSEDTKDDRAHFALVAAVLLELEEKQNQAELLRKQGIKLANQITDNCTWAKELYIHQIAQIYAGHGKCEKVDEYIDKALSICKSAKPNLDIISSRKEIRDGFRTYCPTIHPD